MQFNLKVLNKFNFKKIYKKSCFSVRRGMTFSEVIVTIGIFSIIMVGINQLFVKSWKNYSLIIHTSESSIAANQGVNGIINVLRRLGAGDDGSYAIASVGSFDLKIYSDIDNDGVSEKVHYYLNGTDLMVGKSNPSGFPVTYPASDSETEVLIKNVVNGGTQPIFYYYDGENNTMSDPASSLNEIRMIEVNLFIQRNEGDLNIESYASLRNLSEHDTIK
ncbi:MAG: type IV pilus modification PilV family protein [Candidatus Moraniibacteriota bacterium]